jgi:hypothetical protein
LDEAGYIIDMVEEEELMGYWEDVNMPNEYLWKAAMDKELDNLDKART